MNARALAKSNHIGFRRDSQRTLLHVCPNPQRIRRVFSVRRVVSCAESGACDSMRL